MSPCTRYVPSYGVFPSGFATADTDASHQNILYSVIQDIASQWENVEDRARYQAAAQNFRIPYWDWAAEPPSGESVLPKSIGRNAFVDVDGPNGKQTIANPLFSYRFKPLDGLDFLEVAPVSASFPLLDIFRF